MFALKALCVLAVTTLAASPRAAAAPVTVTLSKFTRVKLCAPFGAFVKPGKDYSLTLDAEQSVKDAVTTSISPDGILTLGTSEDFQSTQPIKLTVTLPATSLVGISINTPVTSQVTVAPGFTPPATFEATSGGSGNLFVQSLNVGSVSLLNNGAGDLYVKGSYKTADVSATGAGTTYLGGGTIGTATVSAGGVAQITIDPTNDNAQITGSTQLLGKITYTHGTCTLSGSNIPGVTNNPAAAAVSQLLGSNPFGSLGSGGSCTKAATSPIPAPSSKWSCGLRVQGTFDCSGSFSGGSSASTSGGSGGTITTNQGPGGSSSTSTSGNGVAFASPVGGQVQFSSAGPGQTASITNTGAVQTLPCDTTVTAAALAIP